MSQVSLLRIFCREWKIILFGAVSCVALAIASLGCGTGGFRDILEIPYTYDVDGLFAHFVTALLRDGYLFDSVRAGYPFGASMADFPSSEIGNLLLLKLFATLTDNVFLSFNLFVWLSFFLCFPTAYVVLRAFGVLAPISFAGALAYDLCSFHFLRFIHTFHLNYFLFPLVIYIGYLLFSTRFDRTALKKFMWYIWVAPVLACFGVYYAVFGCLAISFSGLIGSLRYGKTTNLLLGGALCALITLGVMANVVPNVLYLLEHGKNVEAVQRQPSSSERHGLKLIQMVTPHLDHKLAFSRNISDSYNTQALDCVTKENRTSSFDFLGSFGLLLIGWFLIRRFSVQEQDDRYNYCAVLFLYLFLWGTIGGVGTIFSYTVSPWIRAWNRISIVLLFLALLTLMIWLSAMLSIHSRWHPRIICFVLALLICTVAVVDQIPLFHNRTYLAEHGFHDTISSIEKTFRSDQDFISRIEKRLPVGAGVYQMPYMAFPEPRPAYLCGGYELALGLAHSKTLRWSYGGMKGREGDLFLRSLAQEPIAIQLELLPKLGYHGIYIVRSGFPDYGKTLIAELKKRLQKEPFYSKDQTKVFFRLPQATTVLNFHGMSPAAIMEQVGSVRDQYGVRYQATLEEGLDFRRRGLPFFVREFKGFSWYEKWGRWSDARSGSNPEILFDRALPKTFTLRVEGVAYGPNAGKPLTIRIGKESYAVPLTKQWTLSLPVNLGDESAISKITLIPPMPISPIELGKSNDKRKLGIGLIRLWIEK